LAHLDYYAANLCVLSASESHGGGWNNRFPNKQWWGMEPF
jgi:hypothetical protein